MAPLTISPAPSISETFVRLRQQGKVALITFITAGDPDLSTTAEALKVLDSCGSDIIELGVSNSNPFLDGPVIQAAGKRSLAGGTNLEKTFSMLKLVAPELSCPVALFTYYGVILDCGVGRFMADANEVRVRGLIVPDVPQDTTETLRDEASKYGIEMVRLTTPVTPTEQMKRIVEDAQGFVYLVSTKPVAVGFGISKPGHVQQIARWGADGVIVGSAMVKRLGEAKSTKEGLKELEAFTKSLKSALWCS